MADEPTTGTPAGDGGAATATGTPPVDGGNAPSELEVLQEKLRKLEAQNAQALAEKETLERTKRENAELKARLDASHAPTNGAGPSPYDALTQKIKNADAVLAEYPNDVATAAAKDFYQLQLRAMESNAQQQQINAWLTRERAAVNAASDPPAIKARALEMVESGVDAATALAAAYGESARKTETERTEADRIAAAGMKGKPNTSAGGTTVTRSDSVVALSDYNIRVDAGDTKLMADVDAGRVKLDYTR